MNITKTHHNQNNDERMLLLVLGDFNKLDVEIYKKMEHSKIMTLKNNNDNIGQYLYLRWLGYTVF